MAQDGAVAVVDVSALEDPKALADAIAEALGSTGFLFIRGHGMEESAKEMFRLSERFFKEESPEEKKRCAYDNNRGYTYVSQEQLDPDHPAPDLKEGFNTGFIERGNPPRPTHPLPALLAEHAVALSEFQHSCFEFCQRLMRAFAVALDLPIDFFSSRHHEGPDSTSILRFLHYPAIPPGAKVANIRAGAHSDFGSCTLLFQRAEGGDGLEILPPGEPLEGGRWKPTGMVADAVLVNIGDALELWSGARFKSTLHRVVLPSPIPLEGIPERFSMAFFFQPTSSASLKTCVDVTSISQYDLARMEKKGVKPGADITADQHLQARLASVYKLAQAAA